MRRPLSLPLPVVLSSPRRGPGELRPCGQTCFDRFELVKKVACEAPRSSDVVRHRSPPGLRSLFHGASEVVEDPTEHALELLDVAADEEKLALDLLDREIVGHHLLDAKDLTDDGRRVHSLRALMLALPSDAHAARQK